jgi:glycosyltransferase involved in cell wall biosynthesis
MRVLLVSHNFLPAHAAGTEVYTGELALGLRALGHEVAVFTTDKDVSRTDMSLVRREWRGIEVVELVNNLYHRAFRETWDNPRVEAVFAAELARLRPDVVHFQHLMYLSIGCVETAARSGAAVAFTLHDFWLHCARFGQRLHPDGGRCEQLDFARCGSCLSTFKFRQTALERVTGRALSALRRGTGVDFSGAAKRAARGLRIAGRADSREWVEADAGAATELAQAAADRDVAMRERVLPFVQRFFAPSRFLAEKFVEWGVERTRIEWLPTGLELTKFAAELRRHAAGSQRPLRIGFLGTLAPHKAPHLLLRAWGSLEPSLRDRAMLELRGKEQADAAFQTQLAELAHSAGAMLDNALPRDEVPRWLANLDLLVVPSLWFENAPMVILEALATRTPLLVSALGGMAELVEPGVSGFHVAPGDVDALARELRAILSEPERLSALYPRGAIARDVSENARRHVAVYEELRAGLAAR